MGVQRMDAAEYEALAGNAQALANTNFSRYKFNVAAYALLGYAVIVGLLLALVGIIAGLGGLAMFSTAAFVLLLKSKMLFILVPLAWILLRSLWIKIDHPTGFALSRKRFPALFSELDELSATLKATKIDQVLLTPELNAAVVQTPRLGILGWQRNTLMIGLELLLTMSPAQARAVVAHELGHLSGNHSRFSTWIYRVRQSWGLIMHRMQDESSASSAIMRKFFEWYAPRFSAYSYALAQKNEFDADAISAELTSPAEAGAALVNVHVTAPYIDDNYWNEYFKKADSIEKPEPLPWMGLHDFLRREEKADLSESLKQSLQQVTNFDDTHPCLSDRLDALDVLPTLPEPSPESAAQAWFASEYNSVLKEFDVDWLEANGERWKQRFSYVTQSQEKLQSFVSRHPQDLSDEELWTRAILSEEFEPAEIATIAISDYQKRHPNDTDAAFLLGRHLYQQNDEACLQQLEKATSGQNVAFEACQFAYWFESARDNTDAAEIWRERAQKIEDERSQRLLEHEKLTVEDKLRQSDLSQDRAVELVAALKANKKIKKAWIAEKILQHDSGYTAYAVAITLTLKAHLTHLSEDTAQKHIAEELGVDAWIIPRNGGFKPLAKHIIKHGDRVI